YQDKQKLLSKNLVQKVINQTLTKGECRLWYNNYQIYSFLIEGSKGDYVVTATGYDENGFDQLQTLKIVLCIAYLIIMLFIIFALRIFIRQAFSPISLMVDKVKNITKSQQLDIRLDEGNQKDELSELAVTFNQMLTKIETSFEAQKQFFYNISHELRTPLAAIITELELSKSKDMKRENYEESIDLALHDAKRLAKLYTGLLDMAKTNYRRSEIAMHEVRLDELLLEVCRKIQKYNSTYTANLFFDKEECDDDRLVSILGNEYLLSVAFSNIIDNGCKYSPDKMCEVHISYESSRVIIRIVDHGIGIKEDEQSSIFTPFFRGSNKDFTQGNGIGLSLSRKIIEIHDGSITFESKPGLSIFHVSLRNIFPE
ncbi:MAG: HAMP domain-containing sensor histidine kinase, partial [Bacteroidales bacterium]